MRRCGWDCTARCPGRSGHGLRVHVWPHLRPRLGAGLGFHDQPTLTVAFTDGLDTVPDVTAVPLNADLSQLISFARWTWLDTPEGLAWLALLLTLLTLALKDADRAISRPRKPGGAQSGQSAD